MSFSLIPQYAFRLFTDISPGFLSNLGVRFLMLDLDNTVARYSERIPSIVARQWADDMSNNNITLFFISNNRRKDRVRAYADALGIGFIKEAQKPSPTGILKAIAASGFSVEESAFMGDQIFTDTLAANRAGVISIIVRPLSLRNPLLSLRFAFEAPFRAACRNRNLVV